MTERPVVAAVSAAVWRRDLKARPLLSLPAVVGIRYGGY
jgi:hypothetical protein